ncbi:MAG TPA: hypothetical protein GX510_05070 [Firmicutes bacterium]|nr:hypothetical protein [Candidatus Fermentithermobacillaceae bacterium]
MVEDARTCAQEPLREANVRPDVPSEFHTHEPGELTDTIDLVAVMQTLVKRRKIALIILAVTVTTTLVGSIMAPKRYEAVITVFIRDLPQARAAGVTPQTLVPFAVSDRVLLAVSQDTELAVLRSSFNVKLDAASRVLTVTVSAPTAREAQNRAERWLESFTAEACRMIAVEQSDTPLVEVFEGPTLPGHPASPRVALNIAVGTLLGAFAGVAAAFVLESLERIREHGSVAPPHS